MDASRHRDMQIGEAIRRALDDDHRSLSLIRTDAGGWQANLQHRSKMSFTVECDDDPIEALWKVCVPFRMRHERRPTVIKDLFHPLWMD